MYGVASFFFKKTKSVVLSKKNEAENFQNDIPITIISNSIIFSEREDNKFKEYSEKISIIIPTKNAGSDFEYLLKVLKDRKDLISLKS